MKIWLIQAAASVVLWSCEDDKRLHVKWSFWLTVASALIWPLMWAMLGVFVLGMIKECWDHYVGSGFCLRDIAANSLGIGSASMLLLCLP